LQDVADSINVVNENIFEVFFLPAQYYFFKTTAMRIQAGGGLYYEYDRLNEKGFFNMPELETLAPPRERVNSYTNKFSMHITGPLIDAGIDYNAKWFNVSLSAGLVPVFFLHSTQRTDMVPLMDPHYMEYDQNTGGSPYFYLSLDSIAFKYINIVLLYDFARLNYKTVDFDSRLNWITPEREMITQSLKIETSVLLPLDGNIRAQIGYGFTVDFTRIDSGMDVRGNRHYLILTVKKIGR
jgi:hypothetical protein